MPWLDGSFRKISLAAERLEGRDGRQEIGWETIKMLPLGLAPP